MSDYMRFLSLLVSTICSAGIVGATFPALASGKCILVEKSGANTPFDSVQGETAKATDESGDRFNVIERLVRGNVSYELRTGHGQSLIVALQDGKPVATSFSGYSIDLNLIALGNEVGCFCLNGVPDERCK
jgi:hypothetical protein